jgi:hypothetical protein
LDVLRIGPELNGASLLYGAQGKNDGANFHAIVCCVFFTAVNMFFMTA